MAGCWLLFWLAGCGRVLVLGSGETEPDAGPISEPIPDAVGTPVVECLANCSCERWLGHEYAFCPTPVNWRSARDACRSVGKELVHIESPEAQEYVTAAARRHGAADYWLGLSSLIDANVFAWDDGTPLFAHPAKQGCVAGGEFKGRCYALTSMPLPFDETRTKCQGLGPGWDLAAIRTKVESDFARGFAGAQESFYVGASDATKEGVWRWLALDTVFWLGGPDGSAEAIPHGSGLEFVDWQPGQPNDDQGADCAAVQPIGWDDVPCSLGLRGLCEQTGQVAAGAYANFGPDQPNDGAASCVSNELDTWWDLSCEMDVGFVCQ